MTWKPSPLSQHLLRTGLKILGFFVFHLYRQFLGHSFGFQNSYIGTQQHHHKGQSFTLKKSTRNVLYSRYPYLQNSHPFLKLPPRPIRPRHHPTPKTIRHRAQPISLEKQSLGRTSRPFSSTGHLRSIVASDVATRIYTPDKAR